MNSAMFVRAQDHAFEAERWLEKAKTVEIAHYQQQNVHAGIAQAEALLAEFWLAAAKAVDE